MATKLKVASLGLGGIVKNRLVDGIEKSRYCSFLGAYDPNMTEEGAQFLAEHGTRLYSTEAGLVSDPEVDIVLIASPHHEHYRQAEMVLDAGKHVWAEKPVATRFSEAGSLYKLAKTRKLGIKVDSMMENNWLHRKAASIMHSGKLGSRVSIETSMVFPYFDFNNFRYTETDADGGGAIWDVGPHCLYMGMMLGNARDILDISAVFGVQLNPGKPHQNCTMRYRVKNCIRGEPTVDAVSHTSFTTEWKSFMDNLFFRVMLERGYIEGYGTMFQHSESKQEENDQHLVVYDGVRKREIRTPPIKGAPNIYAAEFDKLAEPIVNGREPPIDTNGLSLVGVVEAALASANANGKVMKTEGYFSRLMY